MGTSTDKDNLHTFLELVFINLNKYAVKVRNDEIVDWRIKESLMNAIGIIHTNILK